MSTPTPAPNQVHDIEVVIFGGGAAGLWLLDDLVRRGVNAVVLESAALGAGQTIASQGIIHGGLKYTLSGLLTPSARAIRAMPAIWQRCLGGERFPDLRRTRRRSDFCHLWQTTGLRGRLGMVGARVGLQVAPTRLNEDERPPVLAGTPGMVARLEEQVIEPESFLGDLADQHLPRLMRIDAESGLEIACDGTGEVRLVRLLNPETGAPVDLRPRWVVLTAGSGNRALRRAVGLDEGLMQERPLHMTMMRGIGLPLLQGHCVDGGATRITVTSTLDPADRTVWQIGGRVAEESVGVSPEATIARTIGEVREVLPTLDLSGTEWATYAATRAEPRVVGGQRPDQAFVRRSGNTVTAWPTKLALVPRLVELVLAEIGAPSTIVHDELPTGAAGPGEWPRPEVALPPWEEATSWSVLSA